MSNTDSSPQRPGKTLVRGETSVINIATGQVLELRTAETGDIAQARAALIQLRADIDDASHVIDTELARRLDLDNARSGEAGGYRITVNAAEKTEWNVDMLRDAMNRLIAEGRLTEGVRDRAVRPEVTFKPMVRELNKLVGHEDVLVREEIVACRFQVPQRRRATLTPVSPPRIERTT